MASHLELRCVSNHRCKKNILNNITYYIVTFIVDLPTHGSPPCLFYPIKICMTTMVPILIISHRALLKCSEQLAECLLIQPSASNMIMTLIGAPVWPSATNSITMQYRINLILNQNVWCMVTHQWCNFNEMLCRLELCCVSNHRVRNQIQMIALITFLNDKIIVQEYIYGAKISYMPDNFIKPHNKDFTIHMKALSLSLLYRNWTSHYLPWTVT
jgi:hypothetical protein